MQSCMYTSLQSLARGCVLHNPVPGAISIAQRRPPRKLLKGSRMSALQNVMTGPAIGRGRFSNDAPRSQAGRIALLLFVAALAACGQKEGAAPSGAAGGPP